MIFSVRYSLHAKEDIKNIYEYITFVLLEPQAAKNIINKIMREISTLNTMPERYPIYQIESAHGLSIRFVTVKKYIIFFTVNKQNETVTVVRIVYGERDLDKQLNDENIN